MSGVYSSGASSYNEPTMTNDQETVDWRHRAACIDRPDIEFFDFKNYGEKKAAKAVCDSCPVRKQCLSDALSKQDRFGMWGGVDEQELRRALSINQYGHATSRKHPPRCPYCRNERLQVLEKRRTKTHVKCGVCKLDWWTMRALPKKVKADDATVD